jgi:hypothetical protein
MNLRHDARQLLRKYYQENRLNFSKYLAPGGCGVMKL